MKEFGAEELVRTTAQLENLLGNYGIKYVVVEDPEPLAFNVQQTLRTFLNTPQFRLLAVFPIETNVPSIRGRRLLLYENLRAVSPTMKSLRLRMLTLDQDIVVPLSRTLGP